MNTPDKIKQYILKNISKHPSDIVSVASDKFSVSRMTINRYINKLIDAGLLIKQGTTKDIKYYLADSINKKLEFKISSKLSEYEVINNYYDELLIQFNNNIYDICYYGMTEIFNNAIDHSQGSKIILETSLQKNILTIVISDNGIGVFSNIKDYLNLEDVREAILELSKGKVTTNPKHHTGEGIFFTSRVFDSFELIANNLLYLKDNINDDWSFKSLNTKKTKGTVIRMKIDIKSSTNLVDVFKVYQNEHSLSFSKTEIKIELAKIGDEILISRSQAKRVLRNVEQFKTIILDFKDIRLVGQGFADEVFRIFQNKHPSIKIEPINTNSDIDFMIKRSLKIQSKQ